MGSLGSIDIVNIIIWVLLPLLSGVGAWIVRNLMARLQSLDERVSKAMTEEQVRQIIDDKNEAIKDKLADISNQLNILVAAVINKESK